MGKNVTLFSYMVMQHAAHLENLSSYTGPRGRVAGAGKGVSLIRYCGSYGTPVLPEHPGWIANSRMFPRSQEIYSRGLRMNATSARCTGDDTRWNLSRVNRYDVIAARERMHRVLRQDC